MVSAKDTEAGKIVHALSEELKKSMKMPEWALYAKTGNSRQRPPEQKDWWFTRAASVLRRIYLDGPVGIHRLQSYYGGRKRRGHKQAHFRKGSGKIIRTILQDLESMKLVEKDKKGRKVAKEGQRLMDKVAKNIK